MDTHLKNLRAYLDYVEKEYESKKDNIRELINSFEKQKNPKTYLISESDLGYSRTIYSVQTNLNPKDFIYIDCKYGMKYRHESTTIKQMKEGAEKEGYIFNIIMEVDSSFSDRIDYACRFGNY